MEAVELDYCTKWLIYGSEPDPGENDDITNIGEILDAGIKALGLEGKWAYVSDLMDYGRVLW